MTTFVTNQEFTQLASEEQLTKTVQALEIHGIRAVAVETGEEARTHVLDLIPSGAEVYNSPSRTLELIGLAEDIEHATRFQAVRTSLRSAPAHGSSTRLHWRSPGAATCRYLP
jgi:L-lactate utilization protein LutB